MTAREFDAEMSADALAQVDRIFDVPFVPVRKLTIVHPALGWAGNVIFNREGVCWSAAPVWNTFLGLTVAECKAKAARLGYTVKY
jgi:hypothetical protein